MIELGKSYKTRDGREVRIYAVDGGPSDDRVHGAWKDDDGHWIMQSWTGDGRISSTVNTVSDLIEVKPRIKRKVWVNVYPHRMGVPHGNRAYVAMHRGKDAIACVEIDIDVEEGHGL